MGKVRYFRSQVFTPESELSFAEATSRGTYVACHFVGNKPDFSELVVKNKVKQVIYYQHRWPDDDLRKKHLAEYAGCSFQVVLPSVAVEATDVQKASSFFRGGGPGKKDKQLWQEMIYQLDEAAQLVAIEETYLDELRDPWLIVRRDVAGKLLSLMEYEYDETGKLSVSRERAEDGSIISEEFD